MKTLNIRLLLLSLSVLTKLACADDGGEFPGYVGSPSTSGSDTIIKTRYGECLKNRYYDDKYHSQNCDSTNIPDANESSESSVMSKAEIPSPNWVSISWLNDGFDKAVLNQRGIAKLNNLSMSLKPNASITKVAIIGYADNAKTTSTNQKLAQKRADAVANYLVTHGISRNLITISAETQTAKSMTDELTNLEYQNKLVSADEEAQALQKAEKDLASRSLALEQCQYKCNAQVAIEVSQSSATNTDN